MWPGYCEYPLLGSPRGLCGENEKGSASTTNGIDDALGGAMTNELYSTKQVAAMLEIPVWRVKNFSEGKAFRLPPSIQVGTGRGSRRLYDWKDVCRIAIADKLTMIGFTPKAVGMVIEETRP
jgi:hypothetical protein